MKTKTIAIYILIIAWSTASMAQNPAAKPEALSGGSGSGFTLIHEAARAGSLEAAKRLISEGVNVNSRVSIDGVLDPNYDFVDDTPIDVALALEHSDLAKLLREHGGKTASEIDAAHTKRITWGKPVDGLQIGAALAIDKHHTEGHPTSINTFIRNSGEQSRTFLTSVHLRLGDSPEKTSLLASRLKLYKLGGGDVITLFYQKDNHLLRLDRNRKILGTLGKQGTDYTIAELSEDDARQHSITLAPSQQIGPASIRYGNTASWAPARNSAWPDRKSQYGVTITLDITHPQSPWTGSLTTTLPTNLRFATLESSSKTHVNTNERSMPRHR